MNAPDTPPLLATPASRKSQWWKWLLGIVAVLFCLGLVAVIALVLSANRIVRNVARNAIEKNTGLPTQIEELKISFLRPGLLVRGFKLTNTPEFGGGTFLDLPELRVELDRQALGEDKVHLKLVRVNLAELHVVTDEKGRRNTEALQKRSDANKARKPKSRNDSREFAGLDKLDISLGTVRYTDLGDPSQSCTMRFDWSNQVITNITTREAIGANLLYLLSSKGAIIDDEKTRDPFSILQLIGVFFGNTRD